MDGIGPEQLKITELIHRIELEPSEWDAVISGLKEVVAGDSGTARKLRMREMTVAGKTGTAEFCEYVPELEDCRRDEKDNLPTHAWFVGFAPYENPEIAVVTFLYDGGEGSAVAVPVTQKIMDAYFNDIAPRAGETTP
jgi:penicillin-binding protein 2